jgi:nitrite reductase/ring-hydroxylating ferredoxin subunit
MYDREPILVTRDQSNRLHAFSNVCRHRGAIVASGAGNCRSFPCPYHKWTYGLNGKLLGAPAMDGVKNFDASKFGLNPLRVEAWQGNILVNFDLNCQPLSASMGDMEDYFRHFQMGELICWGQKIYDVACNWKMLVENNMEGYHIIGTHQAPGEYCNLKNWRTITGNGLYDILAAEFDEPLTMNVAGSGGLAAANIPGLTEAELRRGYFVTLYPNNLWALQPDCIVCLHMIPTASAIRAGYSTSTSRDRRWSGPTSSRSPRRHSTASRALSFRTTRCANRPTVATRPGGSPQAACRCTSATCTASQTTFWRASRAARFRWPPDRGADRLLTFKRPKTLPRRARRPRRSRLRGVSHGWFSIPQTAG